MRHKWMPIGLVTTVLVMGLALTAQATLIGDSVSFGVSASTQFGNGTTVVTADTSDAVRIDLFTFDPFAEGFVITFRHTNGLQVNPNSFFTFSDLQWQGTPGEITGVTLAHNWRRLRATTSFTADSARIDFSGISFVSPNQQLRVTFQTQHSPVPEPSTMLLMGSGLVGLLGWQWRQQRATVQ